MNYFDYVIAAYSVFVVVLLWDFVAPQIAMRQHLRAARSRAARLQHRDHDDTGLPLDQPSAVYHRGNDGPDSNESDT